MRVRPKSDAWNGWFPGLGGAKTTPSRIFVKPRTFPAARPTSQRGERIDELLLLVPDVACHLELDGQGLPCLVGDSPHGEHRKVKFYSCWLLLVGKAILPVSVLCNVHLFRCLSISRTFPVACSIGHTVRFWFPKCIFVKCIRLTHLYYSNTRN